MEERIHKLEKGHSDIVSLIVGDSFAQPEIVGLKQLLAKMYEKMNDGERGNDALHTRMKSTEERDKERVAWIRGAKWVIGLLGAALAYLIGHGTK